MREADSSSWPFPLLPRALPLAVTWMLGWVSPAWVSSGSPRCSSPSGAVQHQGCGSQLVSGLFSVESFHTGRKFVGLNPPPKAPSIGRFAVALLGKSYSQHSWDPVRARAAFQAWELCIPVTEGLKQGGKERKKER